MRKFNNNLSEIDYLKLLTIQNEYILKNTQINKDDYNKYIEETSEFGEMVIPLHPLLKDAARFFIIEKPEYLGASALQRKFKIGYEDASIIIDQLEKVKIISKFIPKEARKLLVNSDLDIDKYIASIRE